MAQKTFAGTILEGAGAHALRAERPDVEIIPENPGESIPGDIPAVSATSPQTVVGPPAQSTAPQEAEPTPVPTPVAPSPAPTPAAHREWRKSFTHVVGDFATSFVEPPVDSEGGDVYVREMVDDEPRRSFFNRWWRRFFLDRRLRGTWWAIRYAFRSFAPRKRIEY